MCMLVVVAIFGLKPLKTMPRVTGKVWVQDMESQLNVCSTWRKLVIRVILWNWKICESIGDIADAAVKTAKRGCATSSPGCRSPCNGVGFLFCLQGADLPDGVPISPVFFVFVPCVSGTQDLWFLFSLLPRFCNCAFSPPNTSPSRFVFTATSIWDRVLRSLPVHCTLHYCPRFIHVHMLFQSCTALPV